MVYPNIVIPLCLLLGASRLAVSGAATPPCDVEDLSDNNQCGNSVKARASSPGVDTGGVLSSNSSQTIGGISDVLGPITPISITTTEDVSRIISPSNTSSAIPLGAASGNPLGGTTPVGWLSSQQEIHDGIDGYLDIVSASDQGPMSVKIASLRLSETKAGHHPFELGLGTEFGSLVFLAPTEISSIMSNHQVSNSTISTFDSRAVPLSVFSAYNITGESAEATSSAAPITVRLKSSVSDDKSVSGENLCVTYTNPRARPQDESPMQLQPCDDSYLSGITITARNHAETQLWQYDPTTQELQPMVPVMQTKSEGSVQSAPDGTPTATSSGIMMVETAPPISGAETTTMAKIQEADASTDTAVTTSRVSPRQIARRGRRAELESQASKDKISKPSKPESPAQQQGVGPTSFVPVPCVDPYSLVFTPKSAAIKQATAKASQPPA